jgi:hypothetical protein
MSDDKEVCFQPGFFQHIRKLWVNANESRFFERSGALRLSLPVSCCCGHARSTDHLRRPALAPKVDLRFFNFVPACGPDEGLNRAKSLPCRRRSRCLRSDISSQDLMRLKSIHPSTASFWALSRGSDRSHPLSASAAFAASGVGGGKRIQRSGCISLLCRKRCSQTNGAFDRSAVIPSVSYRGLIC